MEIRSEQEMMALGKKFAKNLKRETNLATIIELIGDVGVGKTTFTRGFAEGLGIKEPITSPSFTISKTYAISPSENLIHYDFYRLSEPGIMSEDLDEKINNPNNIIIIEWGESVKELLPENHLKLNIIYNEKGNRELTL